jgi:hypothetical protein
MLHLPAGQLLDSWDSVRGEAMPVRAAALASLAGDVSLNEVMRWSIARRDLALFELRAQVFGDSLDAVVRCPSCDEQLEMEFALSRIRPVEGVPPEADRTEVLVGDRPVACRLPNTEDLIAASACGDVAAARDALLARCIGVEDLEMREQAAALLVSPADVQLNLTCPSCSHEWRTPFDIASFVWRELDEWAQRTLHDIHAIASAYGWTEEQILQLSARRRQTYVEMIR